MFIRLYYINGDRAISFRMEASAWEFAIKYIGLGSGGAFTPKGENDLGLAFSKI